MEISQLNLRARMAYGIQCLLTFLAHKQIDVCLYEDEIRVLSQYTSMTNFPTWHERSISVIFGKYPDCYTDAYFCPNVTWNENSIPDWLGMLCEVGAYEFYGHPTDCSASETMLKFLIETLHKNDIAEPDISNLSSHVLNFQLSSAVDYSIREDDFWGEPFTMTFSVDIA